MDGYPDTFGPDYNVRFWVYHKDSFVKLTLKPEQTITVHEHSDTDEGYSYREETYTYDGSLLVRYTESGGRDCDGELFHYSTDEVRSDDVLHHRTYRSIRDPKKYPDTEIRMPAWKRVSASVYDQYAQTAGY